MTADRWTAVTCLVIAVLLIIALPSQTSDAPLPGVRGFDVLDGAFFPKVAVALFVIASLWLFIEARPGKDRANPAEGDPSKVAAEASEEAPPGMSFLEAVLAAAICAGLIGYVLVVETFGFLAITIIGVCILAYVCGQRSPVGFLFGGIVFVVVVYYLFSGLFLVPLPRGSLWTG